MAASSVNYNADNTCTMTRASDGATQTVPCGVDSAAAAISLFFNGEPVPVPGSTNPVTEQDYLVKYRTQTGQPNAQLTDMYSTLFDQAAQILGPFTVSGLPTPAAPIAGRYARVTDLYGSVDEVVRCRWDGTTYRWVPQREQFNGTITNTSGTLSLTPLVTPPTVRITSTLVGNVSLMASAVNAWIGARQRVIVNGVLGVYSVVIKGLIGTDVPVLSGQTKEIEYGPTGWFAAA